MEATTSFASWAISHLSHAPDVQEQIYAEVKDMDAYDPDNLASAVTLNRVLEETLRLTPALYFLRAAPRLISGSKWQITEKCLFRKGPSSVSMCGTPTGVKSSGEKRCLVTLPMRLLRSDGSFWPGKESRPKTFFTSGSRTPDRVSAPGDTPGLLEVGLVVGAMVKIFKFTAVNKVTQPKAGVSTKPADGVLVDLELRT